MKNMVVVLALVMAFGSVGCKKRLCKMANRIEECRPAAVAAAEEGIYALGFFSVDDKKAEEAITYFSYGFTAARDLKHVVRGGSDVAGAQTLDQAIEYGLGGVMSIERAYQLIEGEGFGIPPEAYRIVKLAKPWFGLVKLKGNGEICESTVPGGWTDTDYEEGWKETLWAKYRQGQAEAKRMIRDEGENAYKSEVRKVRIRGGEGGS